MRHTPRGRPVVFGEVLFDAFPDGRAVLGGAPFNVAWHLQGFGLEPLFISRVGRDANGARVLEAMGRRGMDSAGMQHDPDHPTGTVAVAINDGQPSFNILDQQAYDYIDPQAVRAMADAGPPALLYHGSLINRAPVSAAALAALRARAESVFVDVNLRPPWWTQAGVHTLLGGARWAKLNEDELLTLGGAATGADPEPVAEAMRERYGLELLVVTRGADGAFVVSGAGVVRGAAAPPAQLVDTVGAGDAFSAVTILGLMRGWPGKTIVTRAAAFAAAICGTQGATTEDDALYRRHLEDWN